MNGYLDGIPVDMVQRYEIELYSFLKKSIFNIPFEYHLRSHINDTLIAYFLSLFSSYFIKYFVL